jgi:pyruvate,orthophosphate dikinase
MAATRPDAHAQLLAMAQTLDRSAGCAQDIEFTVESGRLWLLQCRRAKVLSAADAPSTNSDPGSEQLVLAQGRPACPGAVNGVIVTDVDEAEERALAGEEVILGRPTTNPHDIRAMSVVAGIVTEIGGATSHAAVVSRELGVPCVVGIGEGKLAALSGRSVTLDATAGKVLEGVAG